jgi:hypothetical protein
VSTEIIEFKAFEANLTEFKETYDNIVYNLDDPKENKSARSDKRSIGSIIAKLDKVHQQIKAPLKEQVDLLDHERKRIKDQLLGVQLKIKNQLDQHEQKIREHQDSLELKVQEITNMPHLLPEHNNSVSIKAIIDALESIDIDDSFENRKPDAALAKIESLKLLNASFSEAVESEEKEKERLQKLKIEEEKRQKEREEEIKKQAKIDAEKEAEKKIIAAKEAEEKAKLANKKVVEAAKKAEKQAKIDIKKAKEKAKSDAVQAKIKAYENAEKMAEEARKKERQRIEKEQTAKKIAEEKRLTEENKKKAQKEHRAKIYKEIRDDLYTQGIDTESVKKLITAINAGKVRHLLIEY